jgi:5'-nucleotidase
MTDDGAVGPSSAQPDGRPSSRRRALITNDDGVNAPGIRWLAKAALDAGFDVVVAAPDYEASGSSAALTAVYKDRRLAVTRTELSGLPVDAYGVQASPGYIVMLAVIEAFGPRPDLVLSGINRGANTGHVVLHSGTVGAALTAANYGIAALAVSLDLAPVKDKGGSITEYFTAMENDSLHWATASELARQCLPVVDTLPRETVLNLNVPNRGLDELAGIRQAALAPFGHVQMTVAESGEGFVRTAIERSTERLQPGTDVALLSQGYATATVITTIRDVPGRLDLSEVLPSGRGAGQPERV